MLGGMGIARARWVLVVVVVGACGPTVELETESGTGDGTATTSDSASASADETTTPPSGVCGENDTELIGGGPPGFSGFPPPCNPQDEPGINGYRCCSDDPAAVGGALPAYQGLGIAGGMPYFSEANNDLSSTGQCVRVADLQGQGLLSGGVEGCPIPCNPTWSGAEVDAVCGPARVCCQTVELQPSDCVRDPVTGLWRPVTGDDIGELTQWAPGDHQTHQDPNGASCLALAGSLGDEFEDCVRQLTVADQRGYCMALGAGQLCPLVQPGYIDACEALNQ